MPLVPLSEMRRTVGKAGFVGDPFKFPTHVQVGVLGRQLTLAQGWNTGNLRDTNVGGIGVLKVRKPQAGGGSLTGRAAGGENVSGEFHGAGWDCE